ncbi:MAG: aminotransferase class V-fold PLP-dependent enzyme [Candidatus Pacearchaeota archaeon]
MENKVVLVLGERGDTRNIQSMKELMKNADIVFNTAGSIIHTGAKKENLEFDSNINFTSHTLFIEACRQVITENPNKKLAVVYIGTRDQYGKVPKLDLPVSENYIPKEFTDYQSISKRAAEEHYMMLHSSLISDKIDRLKVSSVRAINTYGPNQDLNCGAVVPTFIKKSLVGEKIELWGGGNVLRDFNYVDDVVEALLIVAISDKTGGQTYNLGCCIGKEGMETPIGKNLTTIKGLAELIQKIADNGIVEEKPYPSDRAAIEPGHCCSDISKIARIGWLPKTNLETGLKKTIEFYSQNKEHYLRNIKNIPFGDLKREYQSLKTEIDKSISDVLNKGWFVLGENVEEFEKEFSSYCNKKYGVGVGNGFDALLLTLKALGIGRGDEVITAVNTAIPTAMAIKAAGAKPVFVDINRDLLIDINKIERAITPMTKAIIPVHLYGQVCDMNKIIEIATKNNLEVIEDCAQAHGAEYHNAKVPISSIGCFSFYPSKNLGAYGDGGMVVTNNKELYEKLKIIRNYGQTNKYLTEIEGHNSRLDELHAAILREKLKKLDYKNSLRKEKATLYNSLLSGQVELIQNNYNIKNVCHLYVIMHKKREALMDYLKEKGIGTAIHYPIPLHLQPTFRYLGYNPGDFPIAENSSKEIISLPMFPELKDEEIKFICKTIKEFNELTN